jgi:hypothetical protein
LDVQTLSVDFCMLELKNEFEKLCIERGLFRIFDVEQNDKLAELLWRSLMGSVISRADNSTILQVTQY